MRTFVVALAIAGCWSSQPPPAKPTPAPAPTGGAGYGGTGYAQLGLGSDYIDPAASARPIGTLAGPAVPNVSAGAPTSHGDLDKAAIRRGIKQHITEIGACYEKIPANAPNNTGRLLVQFFIERDGSVSHSSASGIDPVVDACVADVVKHIKFPAPKGGGGVQVSYPFDFGRSAGP